jgi:hypothetical protein
MVLICFNINIYIYILLHLIVFKYQNSVTVESKQQSSRANFDSSHWRDLSVESYLDAIVFFTREDGRH